MRDQPHYLLRRNWPDLCSMADPFAAADDPPPVAADPSPRRTRPRPRRKRTPSAPTLWPLRRYSRTTLRRRRPARTPADPFLAADASPQAEAQRAFEAKVAERAAKEEALTKERKDKAERDLDTFYDQNTDKKAQKQASNRDHDDELKAMLERPVPANPFEKVVELIGGAQADVDNEDTSIMRRLLVRLKNDPKRSNDVDMDALGSS